MNIGIDIDGVIADADPVFRSYMSRLFNKPMPKEAVRSFYYEKVFNLTDEQINHFWDVFTKENGWMTLPVIEGAKESIDILSSKNNIYIITARPAIIKDKTVKWLKLHQIKYSKLIFATEFENKYNIVSKNNLLLDYHIEDRLDYAIDFANNKVKVLLFDYPWNQTEKDLPENIMRVYRWSDVLNILQG